MPKRRKKRKPARPPLTKLDKWLYLAGAAVFVGALFASLFMIDLLKDVYYFSDQSILAVKKHASELLSLPAYFYLMLSVIPIFLVPYANDQPLFGDPKIRYGSPPWAPDCYPIFGRQRHLTRRTPKAHQFRKRMLHFWFAGLLVSLAMSLLSFFGRDCLLRDYSIVSYDMLNRESNRTFPSELSSLELEVVVRHSSWKTFVRAKINTAEGDSDSFESQDFANKVRALALRSMQTLKGMVPPQNVSLQGRDKLRDLVRRGNYTKEETALLYNLFDTEMPVEQNEETGPGIFEKNGLYSIRIIDPKGILLAEYGPYGKKPIIEEVGKLQAVSLQTGTGDAARWTIYYDPRKGQLSEPFMGVLNTDGELVVYIAPDGKAVCVREIFGQYYERFEAFSEDLASTAEPFVDAELSKNGKSFSLTYLSGADYHRKTDRSTLSRDVFQNTLSITEKESRFNNLIDWGRDHMDNGALLELLEKMRSGSFCGNSDNDPSWLAHREAEKLDDAGLLPMLRELIEANPSKAGKEIRKNAYFVMGSLLKNNMEPSYCQFLIDCLRKECDKYVISSMLDSIKCLHIPREVNIEPMIECSRNDKWQIRHSAINALWASNSEPSREAARYWVRQTDEKTFKYELIFAQASLGYIGEPQDIELLEKHVHSRIRDVRDSAQYAINNIKTRYNALH